MLHLEQLTPTMLRNMWRSPIETFFTAFASWNQLADESFQSLTNTPDIDHRITAGYYVAKHSGIKVSPVASLRTSTLGLSSMDQEHFRRYASVALLQAATKLLDVHAQYKILDTKVKQLLDCDHATTKLGAECEQIFDNAESIGATKGQEADWAHYWRSDNQLRCILAEIQDKRSGLLSSLCRSFNEIARLLGQQLPQDKKMTGWLLYMQMYAQQLATRLRSILNTLNARFARFLAHKSAAQEIDQELKALRPDTVAWAPSVISRVGAHRYQMRFTRSPLDYDLPTITMPFEKRRPSGVISRASGSTSSHSNSMVNSPQHTTDGSSGRNAESMHPNSATTSMGMAEDYVSAVTCGAAKQESRKRKQATPDLVARSAKKPMLGSHRAKPARAGCKTRLRTNRKATTSINVKHVPADPMAAGYKSAQEVVQSLQDGSATVNAPGPVVFTAGQIQVDQGNIVTTKSVNPAVSEAVDSVAKVNHANGHGRSERTGHPVSADNVSAEDTLSSCSKSKRKRDEAEENGNTEDSRISKKLILELAITDAAIKKKVTIATKWSSSGISKRKRGEDEEDAMVEQHRKSAKLDGEHANHKAIVHGKAELVVESATHHDISAGVVASRDKATGHSERILIPGLPPPSTPDSGYQSLASSTTSNATLHFENPGCVSPGELSSPTTAPSITDDATASPDASDTNPRPLNEPARAIAL